MRAAAWWAAVWSDNLLEHLDRAASPILLGRQAYDALGRYAPQCLIFWWIWDLLPVKIQRDFRKMIDLGDPPPPPLIDLVAGVATRQLVQRFEVSIDRRPDGPPEIAEIEAALAGAAEVAVAELVDGMESQVEAIRGMVKARG